MDRDGDELEVTVQSVIDELASAANLVTGEGADGVPAVVVSDWEFGDSRGATNCSAQLKTTSFGRRFVSGTGRVVPDAGRYRSRRDAPTWGIELTPEHPLEEIADLAALAEDEGFDLALSSSHYFNRDPFVALSWMASATDEIRLGPGVVNPYETHPVRLAAQAATIDEVSDGRGVFGIGAGDRSALSNLGVEHDRPLRRVLETFDVARDLWAGETVTHEGTFTAKDASLNLEECNLPVYVGAQGPHMLRMSAKHADGVLINAAHPRDLEWLQANSSRDSRNERMKRATSRRWRSPPSASPPTKTRRAKRLAHQLPLLRVQRPNRCSSATISTARRRVQLATLSSRANSARHSVASRLQ